MNKTGLQISKSHQRHDTKKSSYLMSLDTSLQTFILIDESMDIELI